MRRKWGKHLRDTANCPYPILGQKNCRHFGPWMILTAADYYGDLAAPPFPRASSFMGFLAGEWVAKGKIIGQV
jgi:hypothetical protein